MKLDLQECKKLILKNQGLIDRSSPLEICRKLNGFQAQFAHYPEQAFKIRSNNDEYQQGDFKKHLVRAWTIRNTMHVFHYEDIPLYLHRKTYKSFMSLKNIKAEELKLSTTQKYYRDLILEALQEKPLKREELKNICRNKGLNSLDEKEVFDPWGGLIFIMVAQRQIIQLYGNSAPYIILPNIEAMDTALAEIEIARRYFQNYGPVSLADALYYFKCSKAKIMEWMKALPLKSCTVEGVERYFIDLPTNINENTEPMLLAGFDPLLLGYEKKQSYFLKSQYIRQVYTLTGIVKPCILINGNIVGTWKMENKKLIPQLFIDIEPETQNLLKKYI